MIDQTEIYRIYKRSTAAQLALRIQQAEAEKKRLTKAIDYWLEEIEGLNLDSDQPPIGLE